MDGRDFIGGWADGDDGVKGACDMDWAVVIADDDGVDCALEVRGLCCGGICGWGRQGDVVDLFDLSARTCGGLCGILLHSSDMLEL